MLYYFNSIKVWEKRYKNLGKEYQELKYKKISAKEFAPLEAADFFPHNPVCQKVADGKSIGLAPEVWK